MEAVLGLGEDGVGVGFHHFIGDFLAPVGGQAVHGQRSGSGPLEEGGADLVARELGEPVFGFLFHAHAHPYVAVEDVGADDGGFNVVGDDDVAARLGDQFGRGLERFRRGDAELEVELGRRPNPRARDIARAVADEGDGLAFVAAEFLLDGEKVGEDLARVFVVGEGVDGGMAP